ncbi:hypothetical protein GCK72_023582 [Caenorhabditis remanei]|uniref:Uncharacterized protein n=1 Tax=Caenorhabditis remanei TaxID=31234 RepID=A0A6A5FX50_CAERE|nr:hypothetical protein GCK72_023582 [Caenorhabditis remanei]KAF1747123.1 hypothetical protein GCK72_023582 [Caenorhabditis remanei]
MQKKIDSQDEEIDALKLTVSKLTIALHTRGNVVDVMKDSEHYAKDLIEQYNSQNLTANDWKEPERKEKKVEESERNFENEQPVWNYNSFYDEDVDSHESSYLSSNYEDETDEIDSSEEFDPLGPKQVKRKTNKESKKDDKSRETATGLEKEQEKKFNKKGTSYTKPSYNKPFTSSPSTSRWQDSLKEQKKITTGSNKPEERTSNGNGYCTVENPATQPKTGKFVYNYKPPPPISISKSIYPGDMTYTYSNPNARRKFERKPVQDSPTESEVASSEKEKAIEKKLSKEDGAKGKPLYDWGGPPTGEKLPWHK